jgi:hypothetical protein
MIVEERIYTLYPGKTKVWMDTYEKYGLKIQSEILGNMVGYFSTEFGPLNQIIHMWAYESYEERMRRRGLLFQSEEWLSFLQKVKELIVSQENKLLTPAPFIDLGKK